jgi:lipoyl synthase
MSGDSKKRVKRPKLPPWIRVRVGCGNGREEVNSILQGLRLNTVCAGAQCPNLNECWHRGTATFMILGESCTRNCRFCAVPHNPDPAAPEADEPQRLATAAAEMKLSYVVVTSVTRDDLPDGGASQFAEVIRELHKAVPEAGVEVLTPDFSADMTAIQMVLDAKPTVFNHNLETVRRLSGKIRSKATYDRSLQVLKMVAESGSGIPVKSGLMVGLGETDDEVLETIRDLRAAGVSILTIGQYLPPSDTHCPLDRYVEPETFSAWGDYAKEIGFKFVASAPMVRSSYNAGELINKNCS